MEFLLDFPLIPLGAFVVLSLFFAYQLKLYLGEKKKNVIPHIPNLMTNATPLVLPAQQQSQAFMHKMESLQKEQKKQAGKTQKGISFAQAFYVFSILFFFITTTTIFIFSRNKKLSFVPRANVQPTTFPTLFLPTATIPPQGSSTLTASPANGTSLLTTALSPTAVLVSSVSPTTKLLAQAPTPTAALKISPTKSLNTISPTAIVTSAASKTVGGIISPTIVPTASISRTASGSLSPTAVLLSQYGQYNPIVYPSPTVTSMPRITSGVTPATQIPQAGLSFVSIGLLLISVTLLFVGFAL